MLFPVRIVWSSANTDDEEENSEALLAKLLMSLGDQSSTVWMKKALSSINRMKIWSYGATQRKKRTSIDTYFK